MTLLSVILTTRNRPRELGRALTSLNAFKDFAQIIVVDDSDEPSVLDSLYKYIDLYVYKAFVHHGVSKSRNLGMRLAEGQFILFLDDDDQLVDGSAPQVKAAIEVHALRDLIFFQYLNQGQTLPVEFPVDVVRRLYVCNFAPVGSYLFRNRLRLPTFDENLATHEDWDFLLQLFALHPSHVLVETPLLKVTTGAAGEVHRHQDRDRQFYKDFLKIYRRHPHPAVESERSQMLDHLYRRPAPM